MLEKAKVLKDMPRPLWEAYFCDLIDWVTVVNSADWVNDYGADILGFFAKDIPLELKKDVINQWPLLQAAVVPDLLNWWIDKETENKHQFIELHIQLNPHKDAKYIRSYAERQIKKWQKEYKASVKDSLIRFKKKYQKDAEANKVGYSGTGFWVEVFYWIVNSIMVIQQTQHHLKEDDDIDTRIAIVDMLFTNEILLALRAGGGYEEGEKRLGKVQVPDDDYDDDDDEDPDELIKEEARNAKARAQHEEIRKRMLVEEGVVEEASA
jgi:hypothetical protein